MQIKSGLALMIVGSLGLGACAGTTTTQPPVEDRTAPATTAPIDRPAEPGTRALPDGGEPLPGALPDADLLAKRRVHFAFDSDALDMDNRRIVEAHARYLVANPNLRITLEGHADERGTREYNLALGERRAQSVERVMRVLGVSNNRMRATSYGEEKPLAPESNESAWALNRRVEIIYR